MSRELRLRAAPRFPSPLVSMFLLAAACRPDMGGDVGLAITCGRFALTAPTVEITLDSTSARSAGKLALTPLPVDPATLQGIVVELHAQDAMVRCESKAGKFRIVIRGTTPVEGTLQIAARRPVDIVVRTAGGVDRLAETFDPRVDSSAALAWTVPGQ